MEEERWIEAMPDRTTTYRPPDGGERTVADARRSPRVLDTRTLLPLVEKEGAETRDQHAWRWEDRWRRTVGWTMDASNLTQTKLLDARLARGGQPSRRKELHGERGCV